MLKDNCIVTRLYVYQKNALKLVENKSINVKLSNH